MNILLTWDQNLFVFHFKGSNIDISVGQFNCFVKFQIIQLFTTKYRDILECPNGIYALSFTIEWRRTLSSPYFHHWIESLKSLSFCPIQIKSALKSVWTKLCWNTSGCLLIPKRNSYICIYESYLTRCIQWEHYQ